MESVKSDLRKEYLEKRSALDRETHAELSRKIADRFIRDLSLTLLKSLNCFISIKHHGEVETIPIFGRLWSEFPAIETSAPRVNYLTGEIDAVAFNSATGLIENRWQIPEPEGNYEIEPEEIDLVLVPLLCVDERGHRVGYGKGFYDRFLKKCRTDCLKIGLGFFPPIEKIDDANENDVRLNAYVTPDRIYRF